MKIRETTRWLSTMKGAALTESSRGIRAAEKRLESLPVDDGGKGGRGGRGSRADPTRYMTREERRAWEALPESEREEYLRQGREEAEREAGNGGQDGAWSLETRVVGNLGNHDGRHVGWHDDLDGEPGEGLEANHAVNIRTRGGGDARVNVAGGSGRTHGLGGGQGLPEGGRPPKTAIPAFGGAANGAAQGARATGDVASGGTTAGVRAAKKAAEAFRDALESRGETDDGQEEWNTYASGRDDKSHGSLGSMASTAIATAGGMVAAMAVAFAQAAVGAAASLVAILTPVIVAVTTTISIISVIVAVLTTPAATPGGGGAGLVETAVSQEGVSNGSRYWSYTMGSRFVNGSSTPWCACFVSWCANERGYIDEGLFPKSGSVAAYKSFYQSRGLYRDAHGYVPKQGDLIIFGNNAHIGIVQYTEGGRVITIEGNASDAVHTRSYSLTNPRITGYCTPDYPPEDAEDGEEPEPGAEAGEGVGQEITRVGIRIGEGETRKERTRWEETRI